MNVPFARGYHQQSTSYDPNDYWFQGWQWVPPGWSGVPLSSGYQQQATSHDPNDYWLQAAQEPPIGWSTVPLARGYHQQSTSYDPNDYWFQGWQWVPLGLSGVPLSSGYQQQATSHDPNNYWLQAAQEPPIGWSTGLSVEGSPGDTANCIPQYLSLQQYQVASWNGNPVPLSSGYQQQATSHDPNNYWLQAAQEPPIGWSTGLSVEGSPGDTANCIPQYLSLQQYQVASWNGNPAGVSSRNPTKHIQQTSCPTGASPDTETAQSSSCPAGASPDAETAQSSSCPGGASPDAETAQSPKCLTAALSYADALRKARSPSCASSSSDSVGTTSGPTEANSFSEMDSSTKCSSGPTSPSAASPCDISRDPVWVTVEGKDSLCGVTVTLNSKCREWPAGDAEAAVQKLIKVNSKRGAIIIYTDGSVIKDRKSSWGFLAKQDGRCLVKDRLAYAVTTTSLRMEIEAVAAAFRWLEDKLYTHIVIVTDSLNMLKKVEKGKLCTEWIASIKRSQIVQIRWIFAPAHCDVIGNEQADRLARYASIKKICH